MNLSLYIDCIIKDGAIIFIISFEENLAFIYQLMDEYRFFIFYFLINALISLFKK